MTLQSQRNTNHSRKGKFMYRTYEKTALTDYLTNLETNVGSTERVASAIAGGGLITYGMRQRGMRGTLASLIGGVMLFRGATGHCHAYDALGFDTSDQAQSKTRPTSQTGLLSGRIHLKKSVTINRSPDELYAFWRNFENLPRIMNHLEAVSTIGERTSRWKAKAPLGTSVEWDAEVTSDIPNERIGWKSAEIAEVPNSGVVEFRPTRNRGTEVIVTLTYEPPAGRLGSLFAKLFGEEPSQQIAEDLRRFKQLMETGEIITVEGQSSGREQMPKTKKMAARA
jgi:uncharacterized membrane protein